MSIAAYFTRHEEGGVKFHPRMTSIRCGQILKKIEEEVSGQFELRNNDWNLGHYQV